ncbi:NAD(P)(+) transhydrogenase (Re/Si-specific) subunit beta [Shigella flexneri]
MSRGLVTAADIVAAILFISAWRGCQSMKPHSRERLRYRRDGDCADRNHPRPDSHNVGRMILAMIMGGAIGIVWREVEMTQMLELVAVLHSFVGLAAVLAGFNSYPQHETGWTKFWSKSIY